MGSNEKPDAPKTSPKVESFVPDDGADKNAPTPFQQEIFKPGAPIQLAMADVPPPAAKGDAPAGGAADQSAAGPPAKGNEAAPPAKGPQDVAKAGDPPAAAPAGKDVPAEKKVVNDKAEAAAPKQEEVVDPFEHLDRAQLLKTALESLALENRKPDSYMLVRIDGAEPKEMKVSDRVAQLKRGIIEELDIAKKAAEKVPMVGDSTKRGIDDMIKVNTVERDKLCKDLGLDGKTLTVEALGREFQKATGDKPRQAKMNDLVELMATRDALTRLHFAPMAIGLVEAEFRGRGYLDVNMQLGDTISNDQLKKAYETLHGVTPPGGPKDVAVFGDAKEIREAKEVYGTTERALDILKLDQQQKIGLSVVAEIKLATAPVDPNKPVDPKKPVDDPEQHYKNAIKIAETLDVGYLANAAYKPENAKDNIAQEIVDTIRMGSNARLKYAEFLASKGRFNDAQGLMAQVKADSPELIFATENGKPIYRQYDGGKRSYEELDRAVTLGVTVKPATFEQAHSLLFDKLGKDKIGTVDDANKFKDRLAKGEMPTDADKIKYLGTDDAKSTECLKVMKLCRDQYKEDVAEANKKLDKEVESVEAKKKTFDGKDKLSKDEEVEKARLERQLASLKLTKDERLDYIKRIDALTDFTEGLVHLSQGGAKSAHKLFADALAKDPSLDAEFTKMKEKNSDVKTLTELSNMTDETLSGYWQRNYKKFAVAGAATVGTLTGVGLIGLCGYVGAGVTTTAVVASTGGALTGGATGWGIERTVNEKAGWPEFRNNAKVGFISAALVVSPWANQASRALAGTEVAANTSTIGNMASRIGISRGTLAGSMAMSYTFAAGDVAFDKKPVGKATVDATKEGMFNSLLMGISGNWGRPMAQGESAIAKASMLNRYTVGAGFGIAAFPQALSVAFDGKPVKDALGDTLRDGTQNTLMFGLASKMKVTEAAPATGLGRFGVNRWVVGGGFGLAGMPEAKNYFEGKKTGAQAAQDWLTNGLIDTATLAFLKKYGLSDHGTGTRIAAPTMGDTMSYAKRAFLMQESWNVAVSVGTKQLAHDLAGKPYYIKDQGSGFVAPLVADFFDRHFSSGLDPNHPGDRKVINTNLDNLNAPLTSGIYADKKNVDPLQKGAKKGLFFDYSKKK